MVNCMGMIFDRIFNFCSYQGLNCPAGSACTGGILRKSLPAGKRRVFFAMLAAEMLLFVGSVFPVMAQGLAVPGEMDMEAGSAVPGEMDMAAEQAIPEETVVVVLDPGHGGENLGAEYEGYTEKNMTMAVAKAMKEELEKYEGIRVYLTHDTDRDMSLEERAEYARQMDADFLFCLHFNMSEEHNKFGAEVWVSAFGDKYQKGYTFASVEMDLLEQEGLYSRGIKTRLNEAGEDYYGILRHATAKDVPAALIEHCHLDQANDQDFYNSEEKIKQFGILDATAAAKYFGLRSESLGVDYSNYKNVEIPEPAMPVKPDTSEPDVCMIEVGDVDGRTGEVTINVTAADYDSYILYYSYSYDGGETFSDLQRWEPRGNDSLTFVMKVPSDMIPEAVVNVYNGYDKVTESNHVALPSMRYEEVLEAGNMTAKSNAGSRGAGTEAGAAGEAGQAGAGNGAAGEAGQAGEGTAGKSGAGSAGSGPAGGTGAEGSGRREGTGGSNSGAEGGREGMAGGYEGGMGGRGDASGPAGKSGPSVWYFLQVSFVCAGILFALVVTARLLTGSRWGRHAPSGNSKKKRRRK